MTPTQAESLRKLEWAVWLSQVDIQTLREGDWINLAGDLADFVKGAGGLTDLDRASGVLYGVEAARKWIDGVQEAFREHCEKLASMGVVHVMGPKSGPRKLSATSFLMNGRIQVEAFEGQPYRLLMKTDTIPSQARSALASYLVSSGIVAGQIRKCPICGRIFLYKRKPRADVALHCSLKCSRLAATRRYREKKAEELVHMAIEGRPSKRPKN